MSKSLVPKYTWWETANAALSIGMRALEEIRTLARTPGPPGKDGRDGLSIEDMKLDYDGHRTVTFRFQRGENKSQWAFKFPFVMDCGVWKENEPYETGDGVTWGGSFWIAQWDTTDKPETSKAWRLAVKRGRDGKDGEMKPPRDPKPVKVG